MGLKRLLGIGVSALLLASDVSAGWIPEASGPVCVPQPGMPCPGDSSSPSSGTKRPSPEANLKVQVTGMILEGLLNNLFSGKPADPGAVKAARQQAAALAAQREAEVQRLKAAAQAAAARAIAAQIAHDKMMESYKALDGFRAVGFKSLPADDPDAGADLRPGTSFFGLGGGPGGAPPPLPDALNDPMVVDLRHLRGASWLVQEVETSTTEQVPIVLEKALGAATGKLPDIPPGAVAPAVDEKGLQSFRKVYADYVETRIALARSEAALKEARERKKTGGPEVLAAWEKAKSAYDAAKDRAYGAREEAVRVLRSLGAGKDPETFHPPIPSFPALREETWVSVQKQMMERRLANDVLVKRTQKELLSVVPPLNGAFRKVHEGVVLGFGTDDGDASRMMAEGVSCFSNGKSYASMKMEGGGGAVVVSFGTDKGEKGIGYAVTESGRVVGDHVIDGAISLNTPQARKALEQISGKAFDRLVAHSNGASVAEALIREDLVRVNELNIVGGDMSLAKKAAYQDLVDSGRVKRIVVWVNVKDPVVWGTSAAAPFESMSTGLEAAESLARKIIGAPAAGVQYRVMSEAGRKGDGFFGGHFLEETYFRAIAEEFGIDDYTPSMKVRESAAGGM